MHTDREETVYTEEQLKYILINLNSMKKSHIATSLSIDKQLIKSIKQIVKNPNKLTPSKLAKEANISNKYLKYILGLV